MHVDFDLWLYLLADVMHETCFAYMTFSKKMPHLFFLKSECFPLVSFLNKFIKMYSNTISIVHSKFRKKEPLYYLFRPYFLSWTDTSFRDLQFCLVRPAKNVSSTLIMRLLRLEMRVQFTIKVEATLLIPASPWPWSRQWTLLCIQCSGVYCRELWWPGGWQAWPRHKAWPRLRLCALARISKIMIPLNPLDDLLPSFWTLYTHLVTIPWSQLSYICVIIEFYHQHFSTINM